jgi:hypothetical protein
MNPAHFCILAGWISFLGGVASGALLGLFFHRDGWLGGYASWRRRMFRLGHIAFFGLGSINLMFGLSIHAYPLPDQHAALAAYAFVTCAATMSPICFLSGWRMPFRHLFPVPVLALLVGVSTLLSGWQSL